MKWCGLVLGTAIIGGVCGATVGRLTSWLVTEPLWTTSIWTLGTAEGLIIGMALCPPLFGKNTVRDELSNPIGAAFRFGSAAAFCGGIGGWIPGICCAVLNAALGAFVSLKMKEYKLFDQSDVP